MRLAWIPALLVACNRDNPAFVLETDSSGLAPTTTTGPAPATTSGPTTTATADASTTAPGSSSAEATTGEPLPACPTWSEPALALELLYKGAPLVAGPGCPTTRYRGKGTLTTNSLTLDNSDPVCFSQLEGPFELHVGYVDFSVQIPPDTCFEVEVAWNADCSAARSVVIWTVLAQPVGFVAAGVVGSELPPPGAPYLAPALEPADDAACSCEPAAPPPCCDPDGRDPGGYRLRFAGTDVVLAPGESVDKVAIGDELYHLENLRSHVHPQCDAAPLHLDWFAVRN